MIEYIKKLFSQWMTYLMFIPSLYDLVSVYLDFNMKLPKNLVIIFVVIVFMYSSYNIWKEEKSENEYLKELLNGEKVLLSHEAKELLFEVIKDKHGHILKSKTLSGTSIQTNNKDFIENNNPKIIAKYESALKELENNNFITTDNWEIFKVTNDGYGYIDENS